MATTAGPTGRPHPNPQTPRSTPGQRFDHPQMQRGITKLGDYDIFETLGEGSFGKVRRIASCEVIGILIL